MGGEALGPVKVQCPSIGECQGREEGGVVRWGNSLIEAGGGGWEKRFTEGRPGRGDNI